MIFLLLVVKKGLKDVNNDVINLVSHACEERLRHLVEKVSLIAEHRLDIYRVSADICTLDRI